MTEYRLPFLHRQAKPKATFTSTLPPSGRAPVVTPSEIVGRTKYRADDFTEWALSKRGTENLLLGALAAGSILGIYLIARYA